MHNSQKDSPDATPAVHYLELGHTATAAVTIDEGHHTVLEVTAVRSRDGVPSATEEGYSIALSFTFADADGLHDDVTVRVCGQDGAETPFRGLSTASFHALVVALNAAASALPASPGLLLPAGRVLSLLAGRAR